MTREETVVGRRAFLAGGVAASLIPYPGLARAAAAQLSPTPRQTAGPFYPTTFPRDSDSDLVVVRGEAARAEGVVTHIVGRILGRDGRALAGASVEIWQCDARGRYLHPESDGYGPRDRAFQGFGRATADADGRYAFRTIKPVAYPGRTPHIHFGVRAGAQQLTTQMYVAGDPLNERDGLYRSLGRAREAVTVRLVEASGIEADALLGEFDIVL